MALSTVSNIEGRIANLFASWLSWAQPGITEGPIHMRETVTHGMLRNHRTEVASLLSIARDIANDPAFALVADTRADDVLDFIDEMQAMTEEIDSVLSPDVAWASLPIEEKRRALTNVQLPVESKRLLNGRVQLKQHEPKQRRVKARAAEAAGPKK
jgi:hypothetical protein